MIKNKKPELCFQCGKVRIVTAEYEEIINNSLVKSTQSICSDPKCQALTEEILNKERIRRGILMSPKRHN